MIGHSCLSAILIGFADCFAGRFAEYLSVVGHFAEYYLEFALTQPLSMPLAPDNCRQIHMWRVRGFPLGSPPEGR